MKEIKAYVRPEMLEHIIPALEDAGARDMTVLRVDALAGLSGRDQDLSYVLRKQPEKYTRVAKLVIVCRDEQVETFVRTIQGRGRLGESGDGRVFIADIAGAVDIRTGARGEEAL